MPPYDPTRNPNWGQGPLMNPVNPQQPSFALQPRAGFGAAESPYARFIGNTQPSAPSAEPRPWAPPDMQQGNRPWAPPDMQQGNRPWAPPDMQQGPPGMASQGSLPAQLPRPQTPWITEELWGKLTPEQQQTVQTSIANRQQKRLGGGLGGWGAIGGAIGGLFGGGGGRPSSQGFPWHPLDQMRTIGTDQNSPQPSPYAPFVNRGAGGAGMPQPYEWFGTAPSMQYATGSSYGNPMTLAQFYGRG